MADEEPVKLVVVYYSGTITNTCDHCGEVLSEGDIYISLRFPDGNAFALGYEPAMTCCGKPAMAIRIFESEEDTIEALTYMIETLKKEGGFGQLPLLQLIEPRPERVN